jgi:hypothetical protein
MINKIYIPTVCRVDNQITYNNLPKELQKKVVFVVQEWERNQYKIDAEYFVLPSDITIGSKNALARTRKIIYEMGKEQRYAMLDDDLQFKRRNSKYWSEISNMERSSRACNDADIIEMFELFDNWLDNGVTFCGCAQQNNPPMSNSYENNRSMSSCYWINGYDWYSHLEDLRVDEVRVAGDVLLILGLLTRGYSNRVSNEFIFSNHSTSSNSVKSVLWDQTEFDEAHENHKLIAEIYPKYYKILYDENGERIKGGFRNYGKTSIKWTQAYKDYQKNDLTKFLSL